MLIFPFEKIAYANCPVCIITVGGGLFIAKKLGIDDLLVSIWISGLNTAFAYWFSSAIKLTEGKTSLWESTKKFLKNPLNMSFAFYIMTVGYLWFSKQLNHPTNTYLGIDKVLFGLTIGLAVFVGAAGLDKYFRFKNKGKVLFYYQKVILPVALLMLTTFIFKLLIGR